MSETVITQAEPTPLATLASASTLREFAGVQTAATYSDSSAELRALHTTVGVYDLGWRARLRMTGEDRVRWLNGMITNTVRDLAVGRLNYSFLLNAQGRIQGDGDVYALPDAILLATDQAQVTKLQEHLDRFIIMDDVELATETDTTAIGVAGPEGARLLDELGLLENASSLQPGEFRQQGDLLVAHELPGRYVLWIPRDAVLQTWERLHAAGATPCGIDAVEALRILSGIPRYGADIHDKSLAQETAQMRALNFNKGCYLGQEIVERIRSRATVHKGIRALSLDGDKAAPGTQLFTAEKPDVAVGELTSIATVDLPGRQGTFALGTVRTEMAGLTFIYSGGNATLLPHAPLQAV